MVAEGIAEHAAQGLPVRTKDVVVPIRAFPIARANNAAMTDAAGRAAHVETDRFVFVRHRNAKCSRGVTMKNPRVRRLVALVNSAAWIAAVTS